MRSNYTNRVSKLRLWLCAVVGLFTLLPLFNNAQSWAWAQNLGAAGTDRITDVATDAAGNTYVCGSYNTAFSIGSNALPAMPGANSQGCFVAKFNSSGVVQWVHTPVYGSYVYLNPTSITLDASGNIYYGGLNQCGGTSVTFASGNANTVVTNTSGFDGFIVKLNSTGVAQWALGMGYSGAASVNQMALHADAFTGYLFFGVSTATSNLAQPQFQNMNYRAPGTSTNVSMGNAGATGFQEAWYGRINTAAGSVMEYYRLGAGNNATGQEWIEAIRTNAQNGDVYLATTIKNNTTLEYNGGTQTINSFGVEAGKIIKLNANLVYQVQSATSGSAGSNNKLRSMALSSTGLAFIMDGSYSTNDRNVTIGGFDLGLNGAWANTVGSVTGAGFSISAKGIGYDASGNIWATAGGHATVVYNWTFTPAYTAAQTALGSMSTNPGLVLLKLNYSTGSTATWSDFSYIRESAANSNSQGASTQTGRLATAGNSVFITGAFNNTLNPTGLTAMAATGTNGYLLKFGCEPGFTTQPTSKLICGTGPQTLTLATVASGAGNTYQWQKNGVNVNGATNDTLILVNPTIADTGSYTLVATNSCGTTTSNAAAVTFAAQPAITTQPVAGTVCSGSVVTLSVIATGNVSSYNWLYNGGALGTNSVYSGANTATLQISGINAGNAGVYSVNVNGNPNCPSVTSNSVTFTIATAPVITANPADNSLCEGANATIVAGSASGTTPAYQWFLNNNPVTGATGATYSSTSVSMNQAGVYFLRATNLCGTANSQQAIVDITPIPQITSTFSNQSVCQGTDNTFFANDNSNSIYQYNYAWYRNNVNIGGGSSAAQFVPGIVASSGTYFITASNVCGADTSNSFVYTVNPTTSISTQPVSQSVCSGSPVSFSVTALGGNLSFQWKKGANNITGATTATYSIPSVSVGDAGQYSVVITGSCGNVTSNSATLSVATAASIATQPLGDTLCSGDTIRLSVTGSAGSNTTYQWRKGGVNIPYTSASLTIPDAQAFDGGSFDVVITGSCGTITSSVANILVNQSTIITAQPNSTVTCAGQPLTIPVTVAGTNLSYQWQHNGVNITGATQSSYTVPSLVLADSGTYRVVISGTCGNVNSNTVQVTVRPLPVINQQPVAQSVCAGDAATFSVSVTGSNVTYQWKFNGVNITGATGATYTIPSVTDNDAGGYYVAIFEVCQNFASGWATLTVKDPTAIQTQPVSQSVCPGNNVQLVTVASGDNLSYQWQLNGADVNGATSSDLNLNNITVGDLGSYTVIVTGSCGTVTSGAAVVSQPVPVSVVTQPSVTDAEVCSGESITLSVAVAGDNAAIQWLDNGTNVASATGNTLSITPAEGAHYYSVSVTGTCSSVVSDSVLVTAYALPQPTVTTNGFNLSTQTFTGYQWQLNGSAISAATAQTYEAVANGNYSVIVVDANGCSATSADVNVTGVGVEELNNNTVSVYPNPAANVLNVAVAKGEHDITIRDLTGAVVMFTNTNTAVTALDIASLAQGAYTVHIQQGALRLNSKFVKQ